MIYINLFDNIVNAAKAGLIDDSDASEMLERLNSYDESSWRKENKRIIRRYINNTAEYDDIDYDSPEEALLRKEKQQEAEEVYKIIRVALSDYEYFILNESTYKSLDSISEALAIPKTTLWEKLQKIKTKVIAAMGNKAERYKETFQEPQSINVPNEPTSVGYPYEQEMKLPLDMTWQGAYGSVREKRKNQVCRIPEYLAGCKGSNVICTICEEKCTRKECFPKQPELSAEKQAVIMSIIDENTIEE